MLKKMTERISLILTLFAAAAMIAGCAGNQPTDPPAKETESAVESSNISEDSTEADPAADLAGKFSAGFGRRETTPDESVRVGGYGTVRWSEGYYSRMYISCIALTDPVGETALLISWEATACKESVVDDMKKRIEEEFGIPQDHVHITATHNHGTPDLATTNITNVRYVQNCVAKCAEAAGDALADRKEASIRVGSTVVNGLSFVRHYYSESGLARGDNYSSATLDPFPLVRHVADPDRTIQFIRFVRENDKDILFSAWRAHNTLGCGSDYVNLTGGFTEAFCRNTEKELDCYCAYYQCDAGRINPLSRIQEDVPQYDKEQQEEFGRELAGYAVSMYDELKPVESGNMKFLSYTYSGKVNHSQDKLLTYAQKIKSAWDAQTISANDGMNMADQINKELGLTYFEGIHSVYHAKAIVNRVGYGPTHEFSVSVMAIGDSIGFTFDPYEMFDTTGAYIRANSPYDFTVAVSYTDGALAYIPSEDAYAYGCYEADSCTFVKGTAEELGKKFLELLGELKKQ